VARIADVTTGSCRFVVTGAAITEIVRDLVLEGRYSAAMRVLESGVPDLSLGDATKLLTGELRLTGDNEVTLEPELPEVRNEHVAQLMRVYAGVVAADGVTWRPYAVVTSYNSDDVPWSKTPENKHAPRGYGLDAKRTQFAYDRAVYYADDPINDRAVTCFVPDIGHASVLWSQVAEMPPFLNPFAYQLSLDWQAGVATYLQAGRSLDHRGAVSPAERPGKEVVAADTQAAGNFQRPPVGMSPDLILELATAAGVNPELAAGLLLEGPEVASPADPQDAKYGWLSPTGQMYGCRYGQHCKLAVLLSPEVDNPDDSLERGGWIKFAVKTDVYPEGYVFAKRHPTSAQHKTLEDWAAYHFLNLPELPGSQCT
jgi:hypothetical protein